MTELQNNCLCSSRDRAVQFNFDCMSTVVKLQQKSVRSVETASRTMSLAQRCDTVLQSPAVEILLILISQRS